MNQNDAMKLASLKMLQAAQLLEGLPGVDMGSVRMLLEAARNQLNGTINQDNDEEVLAEAEAAESE
jgi:hypothetical protein